ARRTRHRARARRGRRRGRRPGRGGRPRSALARRTARPGRAAARPRTTAPGPAHRAGGGARRAPPRARADGGRGGPAPAPRPIDAPAPVLIRLAAETGRTAPAGGGALLELDGSDVQVTVIAGGRRVSRHVLGTPATAGGDPRRSWVPASWQEQGAEEVLLFVEALEARGGSFREVRRAPTDR